MPVTGKLLCGLLAAGSVVASVDLEQLRNGVLKPENMPAALRQQLLAHHTRALLDADAPEEATGDDGYMPEDNGDTYGDDTGDTYGDDTGDQGYEPQEDDGYMPGDDTGDDGTTDDGGYTPADDTEAPPEDDDGYTPPEDEYMPPEDEEYMPPEDAMEPPADEEEPVDEPPPEEEDAPAEPPMADDAMMPPAGGGETAPGMGAPADAASLAALSPSYTVAQDMEIVVTEGDPSAVDLPPAQGGRVNVASATECAVACTNTPGCNAASYTGASPDFMNPSNCFLKTLMPGCEVPAAAVPMAGFALLIQDCDGTAPVGVTTTATTPSAVAPMGTTTTGTAMPPTTTTTGEPVPGTGTTGERDAGVTTTTPSPDGAVDAGSGSVATGVAAFTALVLGAVVAF